MDEDTKISSDRLAAELETWEHKHFPHYVPLAIIALLLAIGFLGFILSYKSEPQVAGASTENNFSQEY